MDIQKIEALAELMNRQGLSAISITENGVELCLERHIAPVAAAPVPAAAHLPVSVSVDTSVAVTTTRGEEIRSPMVGVFYVTSNPDAPPFIQVGQRVKKGDVLCIIEAMKLMNEVIAERDGEIVEICAENGQLVEYGHCLLKLL
jgi:acetyl-CoA carboxylase biotin carboxyl carrier protein